MCCWPLTATDGVYHQARLGLRIPCAVDCTMWSIGAGLCFPSNSSCDQRPRHQPCTSNPAWGIKCGHCLSLHIIPIFLDYNGFAAVNVHMSTWVDLIVRFISWLHRMFLWGWLWKLHFPRNVLCLGSSPFISCHLDSPNMTQRVSPCGGSSADSLPATPSSSDALKKHTLPSNADKSETQRWLYAWGRRPVLPSDSHTLLKCRFINEANRGPEVQGSVSCCSLSEWRELTASSNVQGCKTNK